MNFKICKFSKPGIKFYAPNNSPRESELLPNKRKQDKTNTYWFNYTVIKYGTKNWIIETKEKKKRRKKEKTEWAISLKNNKVAIEILFSDL